MLLDIDMERVLLLARELELDQSQLSKLVLRLNLKWELNLQ